MTATAMGALLNRPGVRQLIKFCIVGASSFVVDLGLLQVLHFMVGLPLVPSKALSFLAAVANGFVWNRRWTFRESAGDIKQQYPKFLLTNLVGLALNLTILTGTILLAARNDWVTLAIPPEKIPSVMVAGKGKEAFPPGLVYGATFMATVFVTTWNFTAAKFWTFKKPATPPR